MYTGEIGFFLAASHFGPNTHLAITLWPHPFWPTLSLAYFILAKISLWPISHWIKSHLGKGHFGLSHFSPRHFGQRTLCPKMLEQIHFPKTLAEVSLDHSEPMEYLDQSMMG